MESRVRLSLPEWGVGEAGFRGDGKLAGAIALLPEGSLMLSLKLLSTRSWEGLKSL